MEAGFFKHDEAAWRARNSSFARFGGFGVQGFLCLDALSNVCAGNMDILIVRALDALANGCTGH